MTTESLNPRAAEPPARRAGLFERVWAACVAAACLALLLVAADLTPSAAGHGTHETLGLDPCPWAELLNTPCATCGMTTSFAHAAHGRLDRAAIVQPFGALLAVGVAAAFWAAAHAAVTGARLGIYCGPLARPVPLAIFAAALLAAWAYKAATWGQ